VVVSGNYAYVADGDYGLQVINISNPANPTLAGSYNTPGYSLRVAVSGNYAYVADGPAGMRVVNVSNPASPTEVGSFTPGYAWCVTVSGNYAYVGFGDGGVRIVNVSNPANPTEVGQYDMLGIVYGVVVVGNYAYVADGGWGLRVGDVSNPANPIETGYYDTEGTAYDVAGSGIYAYVADYSYFEIFDCSQAVPVEKTPVIHPSFFILHPCSPNPFNPNTIINFQLRAASWMKLAVYDISGREVAVLADGWMEAGEHQVVFEGTGLSSGVYFYTLSAGDFKDTKKMILMK
jgi:hypothetical protein